MGIESWNLYGISYGTRLALVLMHDHPEGVRSVIIDSVYPPEISTPTTNRPGITANAILLLLNACKTERKCNKAFPTLEDHLYAVINHLNKKPLIVDEVEWTGNDFVEFLVSSLYDTDTIPTLPKVIEAAYHKDYEPWQELEAANEDGKSRGSDGPPEDDSLGMFWSVECYEEAPFSQIDKAQQESKDLPH